MVAPTLQTEREEGASSSTPYLSHSRISRYLLCPEQYRLYYVERLRPRYPSANLVFGQIVHEALAALFKGIRDPVEIFLDAWGGAKEAELAYSARNSWEKFNESGPALLRKFKEEELPKIGAVHAVEEKFTLDVSSLDLPMVGIVDLVADVEGIRTVVDFKTSGMSYAKHEAQMSDQLTAYQLAEPSAEQAALCVLVKTKMPKIEWHPTTRSGLLVSEYLTKVELVGREITANRFYKRPGIWCKWCDYLPVCVGNQQQIEECLVQIS